MMWDSSSIYDTVTISELLEMAMEREREIIWIHLIAVAPVAKVQLKSGDLLPDLPYRTASCSAYMPTHALVYHDSSCMAFQCSSMNNFVVSCSYAAKNLHTVHILNIPEHSYHSSRPESWMTHLELLAILILCMCSIFPCWVPNLEAVSHAGRMGPLSYTSIHIIHIARLNPGYNWLTWVSLSTCTCRWRWL